VLDGNPAPPQKKRGDIAPIFDSCLWWPNGWMDQDTTWYEGIGLDPGHIVLDGDPARPRKGAQQPPTFRPMPLVAKRSPISTTAELLLVLHLYCTCKSYYYKIVRTHSHLTCSLCLAASEQKCLNSLLERLTFLFIADIFRYYILRES